MARKQTEHSKKAAFQLRYGITTIAGWNSRLEWVAYHEGSMPCWVRGALLFGLLLGSGGGFAQAVPGTVTPPAGYKAIPLATPTLSPGVIHLLELEGEFQDSVAAGGGAAFAKWFADDAVALNNGKAATLGRGAIALEANWNPRDYQLTWVAQGAQMGPSNDMGFTWGHYVGRAKKQDGQEIVTSGRYMTVWRKLADGSWKVALDASADDAPGRG